MSTPIAVQGDDLPRLYGFRESVSETETNQRAKSMKEKEFLADGRIVSSGIMTCSPLRGIFRVKV
jgi:hypothetical protein